MLFNKIIHFIKYHNAFTIGLVLVVVISGSAMASEGVRNAVIGGETIERQGIDNTIILSADIDNFDFQMRIEGVTEDEKDYYVAYSYNTMAIQDNIWQTVVKEGILTVSKSALAGGDLGLYVSEELGEIIDNQLAYLQEVQTIEGQKGKTLAYETTKYNGLIGLVLNSKTKVLPGYEPVVRPPEPQVVTYKEPDNNQELLIGGDNINSTSSENSTIGSPTSEDTTEPVATSTEPIATSTEPVATTTEPVASSTEPVATSTEPVCEPIEEICDGIDNNCNEEIDENCDCGISSCDSSLNLTGECQNPCLGTEGCGTCEPSCVCAEGWTDCDSDLSNGCEIQGECVVPEPEPEPEPESAPVPEQSEPAGGEGE